MDSIRDFFSRIKKRPAIYLVMLALTIVFSAAEAYNPVIRKYGSFGYVFQHNYMKTLSGWVGKADKFFETGAGAYFYIMIAVLCIFALSAIVSVVFSGYINVLMSAVEGKEKKRGEFKYGIKRNFLKITLYIFTAVVLCTLFFFLLIYSVIPAVSMLMMFFDGNTGVIFTMLLLCVLTVAVMLLAIVFYGMYFSYILPSIAGFQKGCVRAGIKMTHTYCWYLLPKTALFLFLAALLRAALFAVHYGHQSVALSVIVLLITALLRSFLYYIYLYFVFNTFVAMRDDLYPDYYEEEIPAPPQQTPRRRTVKADPEARLAVKSEKNEDDYDDSFEP
ncbi:MAG: hypothetical protein ACLSVG_01435 [Clostridia bacterium]